MMLPPRKPGYTLIGVAWWPNGRVRSAQWIKAEKPVKPEGDAPPATKRRGLIATEQGRLDL